MENVEADATRVLPIVRRRNLAPIRYAHSGGGPLVARPSEGIVHSDKADPGNWGLAADDRTGVFPVVRATRARPSERIRLAGRGRPPEIAHE
jgi:hypothetical protein